MILTASIPTTQAAPQMDSLRIASGIGSLNIFLRHVSPDASRPGQPVLILHGATFPSANSAAWKMNGQSWMDDLATHGYDVYALDFLGYGESDDYPEMAVEEASGAALGNMESMLQQVDRAVTAIRRQRPDATLNLIAHSAGTLVAARYAELHANHINKLVLFGAPAPASGPHAGEESGSRFFQVDIDDQLNAFEPRVRDSGRLDSAMFSQWAATYLASDSKSGTRQPPSVRVPFGMMAAVNAVSASGKLPYDPARIEAPTLIVQGEWDAVTPPAQGLWLFERFAAPLKRFVVLSQGGHRLHLERSRFQFYQEVRSFLDAQDTVR